jgi:uncharacterized membrane protein SpoIIM required for sporulation
MNRCSPAARRLPGGYANGECVHATRGGRTGLVAFGLFAFGLFAFGLVALYGVDASMSSTPGEISRPVPDRQSHIRL